jgi:hypothetical protein
MTLNTVLVERRADILRLAAKYGARDIRVFGSVARGDSTADSDIDFLVDLDADRSLLDLGGLQYELEVLLDCPVDVVTQRGLKLHMRDRVLREAGPV